MSQVPSWLLRSRSRTAVQMFFPDGLYLFIDHLHICICEAVTLLRTRNLCLISVCRLAYSFTSWSLSLKPETWFSFLYAGNSNGCLKQNLVSTCCARELRTLGHPTVATPHSFNGRASLVIQRSRILIVSTVVQSHSISSRVPASVTRLYFFESSTCANLFQKVVSLH